MKKYLLLTSLFIILAGPKVTGQDSTGLKDNSRRIKREEYEKFVGRILSTNGSTLTPSFLLDLAVDPTLNLSLPLANNRRNPYKRNFFFIDGKISSKNNYTPLVSKEKWLPDLDINLSYTVLLRRSVKFYVDEIGPGGINDMIISDASSLFFLWFNTKAGYNYAEYQFFHPEDTTQFGNRITEAQYGSVFAKATFNSYWYPSKRKSKGFSLYSNVGIEYRTNDNNYSTMTSVDVKTSYRYTDTLNNVIDVIEDEATARTGTFKIGESYSLPFNISALYKFENLLFEGENFYLGVSFYGVNKTLVEKTTQDKINTTDLGVSINLPIQKQKTEDEEKPTVANFTLRFDFPDINDNLNSGQSTSKRARLGFTLAFPLIPTHN